MELPNYVPDGPRNFITHALPILGEDQRIVGIAAGGSFISGSMDEYSDVDLVIVVTEASLTIETSARMEIAAKLGNLLTAFVGTHVGEPRLLICLYEGLLKADLKFIVAEDLKRRVEDPVILYDPNRIIAKALQESQASYPAPNRQWIEDAFWVWIHYSAAKIRRGEVLEALTLLGFIIEKVLGPLSLLDAGHQPSGVRRIEFLAPKRAAELASLQVPHEPAAIKQAFQHAAAIYISLRKDVESRKDAEQEALQYLTES